MALRFMESFDHHASGDLATKWTGVTGSPTISTSNARHGSSVRLTNGNSQNFWLTLDSQATWIVGFAMRQDAVPGASRVLVQLYDTATLHVDLRINTSSQLFVTRNGTTLGTGSTALAAATWYYVEFKGTISDTVGVGSVRINGVSELNLTSQDTRNGGNASANLIQFGASNNTFNTLFDDIYMCDGTGSVNNDFLGDVRVAPLLPNGAGNSTQFTPSAGSNYQNVDDATPDGDTTYNESSTTSHQDLFTMGNLPTVPTSIKGIQLLTYDRKTDAGARTLRHVVRTSSTDYESADIAQQDTFIYHRSIREVNPNTTSAWTESEVNGLEAGYKLQS